jgi:hypothetical protein
VRVLRRVPERELARRWHPLRDGGARLDRGRDQALLDDALADDDLRRRERGIGVAAGDGPVERLVAWDLAVKLRRARLRCLLRIDDRGQRLVLHLDELQRVVRLLDGFRHDNRDRVADVTHGVFRQRRIRADLEIAAWHEPQAGHRLQVLFRIGAREYRDDAWRLGCGTRVDTADARVRVGAAQDGGVDHTRERDVVGVPRAAGQQPRILAPPDAGSENSGRHRAPPAAAACCTARTMFW